MQTVVLTGSSKSTMALLIEMAQKLGVKSRTLSASEIEDLGLLEAIQTGETGEYVDVDKYLSKLRSK